MNPVCKTETMRQNDRQRKSEITCGAEPEKPMRQIDALK